MHLRVEIEIARLAEGCLDQLLRRRLSRLAELHALDPSTDPGELQPEHRLRQGVEVLCGSGFVRHPLVCPDQPPLRDPPPNPAATG